MNTRANVIFTKPQMTVRRKNLRASMPSAEVILWAHLKSKQTGVKFRRQHSVGAYVVDFFCAELHLVIEVDGPTHVESEEVEVQNRKREAFLKGCGLEILRFTNEDIYRALDGVMNIILTTIERLKLKAGQSSEKR